MPLYMIVLDEENSELWESVETNWPAPNHHIHDKRVAFVRDDKSLTSDIAKTIGIQKNASGIVTQADYYSGFASSSLVEWLGKFS